MSITNEPPPKRACPEEKEKSHTLSKCDTVRCIILDGPGEIPRIYHIKASCLPDWYFEALAKVVLTIDDPTLLPFGARPIETGQFNHAVDGFAGVECLAERMDTDDYHHTPFEELPAQLKDLWNKYSNEDEYIISEDPRVECPILRAVCRWAKEFHDSGFEALVTEQALEQVQTQSIDQPVLTLCRFKD
tara:strand:- start:655 stop:1221 length:567 start_codon:yes stop_codon:yes gene_type:complete